MSSLHSSDKLPDGPWLDEKQTHEWDTCPLESIDEAVREHGPLFTVHRPGRPPRVFVGVPGVLRDIFVEHAGRLRSRGSSLFESFVGKYSLGSLNGEAHSHARKVLAPPLHGRLLREQLPQIRALMREEIQSAVRAGSASLRDITPRISLRLMIFLCFGRLPTEREDRLREAFTTVMACLTPNDDLGESAPATGLESFQRASNHLDEVLAAEIDAADHGRFDQSTLLGRLLADRSDSPGQPGQVIRDQLVTVMLAGQESTPAAMVHAVYWSHRYPSVHDRLTREIDDLPRPLDAGEVAKAPYLAAVVDEVLRLTSIVPEGITRQVADGFTYQGFDFESGTEIVPCIHAVQHAPQRYPKPTEFDPRRFLEGKFSSTEFLPYGIGVRRCLGADLASLEIKLLLITVHELHHVRVRLRGDGRPGRQRVGPTVTAPDSVMIVQASPTGIRTEDGE